MDVKVLGKDVPAIAVAIIVGAVIRLAIAPFFMDKLFLDLNSITHREDVISIHLSDYPKVHEELIDKPLEERMQLAQKLCSMILSLRKKSNLRVRQPLAKIMIPVVEKSNLKEQIEKVKDLILHEVNVKEIEFVSDEAGIFVKRIKPDFKKLGPKCGKIMKQVAATITAFSQDDIRAIEKNGSAVLNIDGQEVTIDVTDVEIVAEDIPGWVVANQDALTVALDIELTEDLLNEGYAREFVNRIQNYRKDSNMDVSDRITASPSRWKAIRNSTRPSPPSPTTSRPKRSAPASKSRPVWRAKFLKLLKD